MYRAFLTNNVSNTLQQLTQILRDAVTNEDLDLIHQADDRIRSHIQDLVQQPDVSKVKQEMEVLMDEYQHFIARVKDIQTAVSKQLRDVQRGNRGSSAYCELMRPSIV